jgi:hypothetical protein
MLRIHILRQKAFLVCLVGDIVPHQQAVGDGFVKPSPDLNVHFSQVYTVSRDPASS